MITFILNMVIIAVSGTNSAAQPVNRSYSTAIDNTDEGRRSNSSNAFSQIEHHSRLVEDAENDRYNPSTDNRLRET